MGAYGLPALILMWHLLRPHDKRTHSGTIKGTWKNSFLYIYIYIHTYIYIVNKMILNIVFLYFKTNSCAQFKKKRMI